MKYVKKVLFLVGVMMMFLSGAVVFAANASPDFYATQWTNSCQSKSASSDKICIAEKSIFQDKALKNRILTIAFRTSSANKKVVATIVSPLGTSIAEGVMIEGVEDKPMKLPFLVCEQNGCVSQFSPEESWLTGFAKSKEITWTYQLLGGKKIGLKMDIENFEKVLSEIKQ